MTDDDRLDHKERLAGDTVTRAVVRATGGPEMLQLEIAPAPVPDRGQVAIRTEATGVAFADVLKRQGRVPAKLPVVPGQEVVGHVTAVGPGVDGFEIGDRVAAFMLTGGYATAAIADANLTVPVPADLNAAQVTALVMNYLTAWQLLHRVAQVRAEQSILVLGAAGGVGSALTDLALLAGARVYGTASAHRRPTLAARGVTVVTDQEAVPEPVDATFDPVGGSSLERSRRATNKRGVVVTYGIFFAVDVGLSQRAALSRAMLAIARGKLMRRPRLLVYSIDSRARRNPTSLRPDLLHLVDLLAHGAIHPVVTTMPLTEAADAHTRLEARQVIGKLVLVP